MTCVSFTLSGCALTSYLLVLTLSHRLLSIRSCHIFFCIAEELSIVCGAVPLVLLTVTFPLASLNVGHTECCFHIMRYSCAVSSMVLATQYWPICKDVFDKDRIKTKEKSLSFVGPDEPQGCSSVADKPDVTAQSSCYRGLLHWVPGLGSSGHVGPG